jgi:hypothetical protein
LKAQARSALLVSRAGNSTVSSGIGRRVEEIAEFLIGLNFSVERVQKIGQCSLKSYDLICICSFVNAFQLFFARRKCIFLWFDSMDSWRLTRKSLFRDKLVRECLKFVRDFLGTIFYSKADVITYCSKRDAEIDGSKQSKVKIFAPKQIPPQKLLDFGERYVFVGPSDYYPNRAAYNFLISLAKLNYFNKVKLHVYGLSSMYSKNHADVFLHGVCPDSEVYGLRDKHLVPLWSGAGVKYKTLVPLSLGIRVISTIEGANGLLANPLLLICRTRNDFQHALAVNSPSISEVHRQENIVELDQRSTIEQIILESLDKQTKL